jgi:U3 small nucleolar RNA-associated protein 20
MLFHVKNKEELSIRVNAGLALRHFIKTIGQDDINKEFISSTIIPGIQFGLRDDSELVRIEFLSVLGQLVETFQGWAPVADLHILSGAEGLDDEASFFTNILHIQSHRRLRALRRLATLAPQLAPGNIYHIMIPLLEHFVFNKADDGSNSESANALSGETGKTITSLCLHLDWPQYRSLLRRYIGYLSSKEDMQKTVIKLLSGLFDSLNRAGKSKGYVSSVSPDIKTTEAISEAAPSNDTTPMDIDEPSTPPILAKGLPSQEKLAQDLTTNILPPLQDFLRKKDDSTVSLRVPVAIAVCKALLLLPPTEVEARLPAVLLDISYILKSKDQGSRDQARNTLCEIAIFTGASYLGFILRALRIALARGYQLHVLSFTMHSILVKFAEQQLSPGELDYCIPEMVRVPFLKFWY